MRKFYKIVLHGPGRNQVRRVPLLVLSGDRDIVTKVDASRTIAQSGAGGLKVFEDVNRMGFPESADLYHLAIENFVAGLEPRAVGAFPAV